MTDFQSHTAAVILGGAFLAGLFFAASWLVSALSTPMIDEDD